MTSHRKRRIASTSAVRHNNACNFVDIVEYVIPYLGVSTLLSVASMCSALADRYLLRVDASADTIMLYMRAFLREHIALRKFDDMDNTPTRDCLRPYYRFAHESPFTVLGDSHRYVCTLVAPAIRQCYKGVGGVPPTTRSYAPEATYAQQRDIQFDWVRIRTKHWQIKQPLTRMVAMYAQRHEVCAHAAAVRAWLARVRAHGSRSRKMWQKYADELDRPVLANFCQG